MHAKTERAVLQHPDQPSPSKSCPSTGRISAHSPRLGAFLPWGATPMNQQWKPESAEQSCTAWREELVCEQIPGGLLSHHVVRLRQKVHTDLGLSLRFVPLVAFTETERTWAETINTAGYQGLFLPWQEHHSAVLPWLQDIPLPSSQGHFPQDPWRQRARAGHAGDVWVHSTLTLQGKSQGWVISQLCKATLLKQQGRRKKKSS